MSHDDLPIRAHYEPPIEGPHEVVGEEGITHHLVFAGPNARRRPGTAADPGEPIPLADLEPLAIAHHAAPRPRWKRILLAALEWAAAVIAFITFALLTMAWTSLDTPARIATTAIVVIAAAAHWAVTRARRRKVRN